MTTELLKEHHSYWKNGIYFHEGFAWGIQLFEAGKAAGGRKHYEANTACLGKEAVVLRMLRNSDPRLDKQTTPDTPRPIKKRQKSTGLIVRG